MTKDGENRIIELLGQIVSDIDSLDDRLISLTEAVNEFKRGFLNVTEKINARNERAVRSIAVEGPF